MEYNDFIISISSFLSEIDIELSKLVKETCNESDYYKGTEIIIVSLETFKGVVVKQNDILKESNTDLIDTDNNNYVDFIVEDSLQENIKEIVSAFPYSRYECKFPYILRYGAISINESKIVMRKILSNYFGMHDDITFIDVDSVLLNGCIIYLRSFFDKKWYSKMHENCDNKNMTGFMEEYRFFFDKLIENILEKWREKLYYGLSETTINSVLTNKAVQLLTLTDMLKSRFLPGEKVITKLSNIIIEGEQCFGKIAFLDMIDYDSLDCSLFNDEKIIMENAPKIRKLLEIAKDDTYLVAKKNSEKSSVYGFKKLSKEEKENNYLIEFFGKNRWRLLFGKTEIVQFYDGLCRVPRERIDFSELKIKIKTIFGSLANYKKLEKLIRALSNQTHGTMLVIDEEATISKIFNNGSGFKVYVNDLSLLDEKMVTNLGAIDGAIVISPDCKCTRIGYILKSNSRTISVPERGARYNSAKSFINKRKKDRKKCLIVVFSEDGHIDLLDE